MKRLCNYALAVAIIMIVDILFLVGDSCGLIHNNPFVFFIRSGNIIRGILLSGYITSGILLFFILWFAIILPRKSAYNPIRISLLALGVILCMIEILFLIYEILCMVEYNMPDIMWLRPISSILWIVVWILISRIFSGKMKIIAILCAIFAGLLCLCSIYFTVIRYSYDINELSEIYQNNPLSHIISESYDWIYPIYQLAIATFSFSFYKLKKQFNNGK